jgi:N-acetylglutamate synthase
MWSVRNAYRAEMRSHERRSSKSLLAKGIMLGLVAVAPDVAGPIGARVVVGRDSRCTRGTLPEAAKRVLTAVPETVFVHVHDAAGGLVAVARGTVTGLARWHGISLLQTAPEHRRRGLARHVVRAMAQWAAQRGATRAYLQVEEGNADAIALYRRLGFSTHHTYLTRVAPPA